MRTFAAIAATILTFAAPAVAADKVTKGRCLLVVDGREFMNGPCKQYEGDGAIQIVSSPLRAFAYIKPGIEDGSSWNGFLEGTKPGFSSHAHNPLGTLTTNGPCWTSARVVACFFTASRR